MKVLTHNWQAKLISLFIGLLIWYLIKTHLKETQIEVPADFLPGQTHYLPPSPSPSSHVQA